MASSRFPRLCNSGFRASGHGDNCDGNAESTNLVVLPRMVQLPRRISECIATSRFRLSLSSESESLHSHGVRAEAAARFGRREIGMASPAFFLLLWRSESEEALAGGLDKYLKRKKLDPLDTYVPTVLLAQLQFQEVDGKLEAGELKTYADARSLLRTGPAASFRTDIRAVAQYASESGNEDGSVASAAVDQCLSALEDLDSLLLQASRSNGAPVERMKKDLTMTVSALDRLLATVPTEILEKSKAIADAYKESSY